MYRYDFYLRSGKTVTLSMVGPIEKTLTTITRALANGERAEDQWLSEPGFTSAVRWTDIEGWSPNTDIEVTSLDSAEPEHLPGRVTPSNPNVVRSDQHVPPILNPNL